MQKALFEASIEMLVPILSWIRTYIAPLQLSRKIAKHIELSTEEAVVNIIQHAYKKKKGEIEISLNRPSEELLEIFIKDKGPYFNPLTIDSYKERKRQRRKEGGLGILFIKECMDEVRYQRVNGYNVLTLVKKIY